MRVAFALLLTHLILAAPAASQTRIALLNGRWFNGSTFDARTMYVENGVLRSTSPASIDTTIDLQGGYVVPPFGEAHNHNVEGSSRVAAVLASYINDGIFYVLNPNSLPRSRTTLSGKVNVPTSIDVIFSNGGLNVTRGHPWDLVQRNIARGTWDPADAEGAFYHTIDDRTALEQKWPGIVAGKPDFIKIYLLFSNEHQQRLNDTTGFHGLDPAIVPDIVKRAHAANLRVAAHIENVYDFRTAVAAGVDIIAHMPGYGWLGGGDSTQFVLTRADTEAAAKARTAVVTTLGFGQRANDPDRTPALKRRDALNASNLKLLKEAGVRIAIGSDNYRAHSRSDALYLSDLGVFTNLELLKLWSEVTPRVIFPERMIGELRDGYEASFLVLQADPLADFNNTARIWLRVKQGRLLP
jgi:imidazolonepropionase-like amidohydrolase